MGCGTGQKEATVPIRVNTVTGKLKITITNAVIFHKVSAFKMDPYIVLKLSNQTFTSKVVENGDKEPSFFQSFFFYVNSCYKTHGRNLEVTLMDKKKVISDGEIGFGIVDLDPVINFKKPKDEFRCFVNYNREQAGFVNVIAQFHEESAQTVSFRFETASIRRKTSTFGNMNCWVKVVIGEEVLHTTRQKDTKQMPPVWANDVLTFNVPQTIKSAQVVLLDDDTEVGRLSVQLPKLLQKNTEQSWNEELSFNGEINAGSIKFQTLTGVNPTFSEVKVDHKKPKEEKKDDKKDQKKDGKKDQKKEKDEKKQENKKDQSRNQEFRKQEKKVEESKETRETTNQQQIKI